MLEVGLDDVLPAGTQLAGAATMVVTEDVPAHTHAFIEIAFVTGGVARHRSPAGGRRVRRGDVVLVRPGSWHAYDQRRDLVVTNAYLRSELVHRELAWLMDYPSVVGSLLRPGVSFATIGEESLVRSVGWLRQLTDLGETTNPIVQLGLTTCALAELTDADFAAPSTPPTVLTPVVRSTMARLEAHPEHPWTLADLAQLALVSPSSLQRQFRQQVDQSPLEWLRQLRGERAATLLARTDLPVSEIGRRIGWEDPNYMSRRFRMIYGVSPSGYRARFQPSRLGAEILR